MWPEVQAELTEGRWIHRTLDRSLPPTFHIDTHHLRPTLGRFAPAAVRELTVHLQRHPVISWVDGTIYTSRGRRTEVLALAAAKRRAYRTLLGWTFKKALCGQLAEDVVWNVLQELKGSRLWVPPNVRPGRVSSIEGRPITIGGPLDAAGAWPTDPESVRSQWVPFAVEVKNLRSILYPYEHDVWDLLAKLGDFPDVVPILVARRLHFTTFRMLKDLGALGHDTRVQHFSQAIDPALFAKITRELSIADAVQTDPQHPPVTLRRFFGEIAPKDVAVRLARWEQAAPIVLRHSDLRRQDLDPGERRRLWRSFTFDVMTAGLYTTGGWGPKPYVPEEDEDEDEDEGPEYWDEADWDDDRELPF